MATSKRKLANKYPALINFLEAVGYNAQYNNTTYFQAFDSIFINTQADERKSIANEMDAFLANFDNFNAANFVKTMVDITNKLSSSKSDIQSYLLDLQSRIKNFDGRFD